jgi:hypothetical protein
MRIIVQILMVALATSNNVPPMDPLIFECIKPGTATLSGAHPAHFTLPEISAASDCAGLNWL